MDFLSQPLSKLSVQLTPLVHISCCRYAFEYGLISFVLMSTEHNFSVGSHQYQFLERVLAKVDRNKTPWLVFSGHRPMYVDSNNNDSSTGDLPVSKLLISELEPLLLVKYIQISTH